MANLFYFDTNPSSASTSSIHCFRFKIPGFDLDLRSALSTGTTEDHPFVKGENLSFQGWVYASLEKSTITNNEESYSSCPVFNGLLSSAAPGDVSHVTGRTYYHGMDMTKYMSPPSSGVFQMAPGKYKLSIGAFTGDLMYRRSEGMPFPNTAQTSGAYVKAGVGDLLFYYLIIYVGEDYTSQIGERGEFSNFPVVFEWYKPLPSKTLGYFLDCSTYNSSTKKWLYEDANFGMKYSGLVDGDGRCPFTLIVSKEEFDTVSEKEDGKYASLYRAADSTTMVGDYNLLSVRQLSYNDENNFELVGTYIPYKMNGAHETDAMFQDYAGGPSDQSTFTDGAQLSFVCGVAYSVGLWKYGEFNRIIRPFGVGNSYSSYDGIDENGKHKFTILLDWFGQDLDDDKIIDNITINWNDKSGYSSTTEVSAVEVVDDGLCRVTVTSSVPSYTHTHEVNGVTQQTVYDNMPHICDVLCSFSYDAEGNDVVTTGDSLVFAPVDDITVLNGVYTGEPQTAVALPEQMCLDRLYDIPTISSYTKGSEWFIGTWDDDEEKYTWAESDCTVTEIGDYEQIYECNGCSTTTQTEDDCDDISVCYYMPEPATVRVASAEIPVIEGITLTGYNGVYDGEEHTVTLSGTIAGDTVLYSENGGVSYSATVPTYIEPDSVTVFVKVSRSGYEDWIGSANIVIDQRRLTITNPLYSNPKTYDGTTAVPITTGRLGNFVGDDAFELSGYAATATSKNVGPADVTVTYSIPWLYTDMYLAPVNSTFSINIIPASLRITGTEVDSKIEDGTTSATIRSLGTIDSSGVFGNDEVRIASATASFADANVGANKEVTVTYTLGGRDAGNYVATSTTLYADIESAVLPDIDDVTLVDWSGAYDGLPHSVTFSDPSANSDTIIYTYNGTESSVIPTFTNVGTYTVSVRINRDGYNEWTGSAGVTISPATITGVTVTDTIHSYDSNAYGVGLSGTEPGDTVLYSTNGTNYSSNQPTYVNVGSYTVYVKVQRPNYNDWTGSANVVISTATLTGVAVTGVTVVYDGADHTITVSGTEAGDTVLYSVDGDSYTSQVPKFSDAGTYDIRVKVQRANYDEWVGNATLTINQRQLTVSGTVAENKQYDGTTTATFSENGILGNVIGNDRVIVAAKGAFPSSELGTWSIDVSYTIGGAASENYIAPVAGTVSATIDQRQIRATNVIVNDKSYDGTTTASLGVITYRDILEEDEGYVEVDAVGSFASASVGQDKPVTITYTLSGGVLGDHSSYYQAPETDYTHTADIIATVIENVGIQGYTGTYDGVPHSVEVTVPDAETDTVTYSTDSGADKVYTDTVPLFTDAGTYVVYVKVSREGSNDWLGSGTVKISKKQLTATGSPVIVARGYDGTNIVQINTDNIALNDVIPGDSVILTASGVMPTSGPGLEQVVITYKLEGDSAGNYLAPSGLKRTGTVTIAPSMKTVSFIAVGYKAGN